ncbi:MAG: hypothetical protein LAT65_21050 [Saccharospirillum sp.]|nr:hypothetical protein [Saccharospirillum sp.]
MFPAPRSPARYKPFKPLTGLVRLVYRLTHPPSMHHIARTLPYLNMIPNGDVWRIHWQGQFITETHSWSEWCESAPSKLYIVGSGPSVRKQCLTPLADAACVLLNGAVTLCRDGVVKQPYAVMIEDARFVQEKGELLRCLPQGTRLCLVGSAVQALGAMDPTLFEHFNLYFLDGFETPYGKPKRTLEEVPQADYRIDGEARLSLNLQQGHFGCGTVMYAGVQLGFHLRVKRMLLVGFDMKNFSRPRFYETHEDASWCGLEKALHSRTLPAFILAADTAHQMGMTIENCSHCSAVPHSILPFNPVLMPESN